VRASPRVFGRKTYKAPKKTAILEANIIGRIGKYGKSFLIGTAACRRKV
jgi:hypothetical protein